MRVCARAYAHACVFIKIIRPKDIALLLLANFTYFYSCLALHKVISSALNWRVRFTDGNWGVLGLKKIHLLLGLFSYKQGDWRAWIGYLLFFACSISLSLFPTHKNVLQTVLHILLQGVSLIWRLEQWKRKVNSLPWGCVWAQGDLLFAVWGECQDEDCDLP